MWHLFPYFSSMPPSSGTLFFLLSLSLTCIVSNILSLSSHLILFSLVFYWFIVCVCTSLFYSRQVIHPLTLITYDRLKVLYLISYSLVRAHSTHNYRMTETQLILVCYKCGCLDLVFNLLCDMLLQPHSSFMCWTVHISNIFNRNATVSCILHLNNHYWHCFCVFLFMQIFSVALGHYNMSLGIH